MINSMVQGIKSLYSGLTGKTDSEKAKMSSEATRIATDMEAQTGNAGNKEMGVRNELLRKEAELSDRIGSEQNELNASAREYLNLLQ
jgi:hypothetical protein